MTANSRPARARDFLQRRCDDLVAAETARLSRRLPALPGQQLGLVQAALTRVAERLVLSRASDVSGEELKVLFDLAGAP